MKLLILFSIINGSVSTDFTKWTIVDSLPTSADNCSNALLADIKELICTSECQIKECMIGKFEIPGKRGISEGTPV